MIRTLVLASVSALIPAALLVGEPVFPEADWVRKPPAEMGLDEAKLWAARDYALTGGGSGYVTRGGVLVMSWGDPKQRYDLKSTTKSIGMTAVGLALHDGKLRLTDKAADHHPGFGVPPEENRETGWLDQITLMHLATHTAGFEKPGGYTRLTFARGTRWAYSDGGPNWLAECVTLAYRRDLEDVMFERVFIPLGITRDDLRWRKHAYRPALIEGIPRREFGSGIHANVDAMARVGLLYLRGGRWNERQLIPREFVDQARTTVREVVGLPEVDPEQYGNASDHYGLLWWNNADGTLENVPKDAYWSWGLYDSLIVVIPSLDVVVARAGKSWKREQGADHYAVLRPFLEPIAQAVLEPDDEILERRTQTSARECEAPAEPRGRTAPYPPGPVITGIDWAPAETIIRKARGSDNWPLTWADDDHLYTAYGDGRGFRPYVDRKLSLGLARVGGFPPEFTGTNLRAPTLEQIGDGARGKKFSGDEHFSVRQARLATGTSRD